MVFPEPSTSHGNPRPFVRREFRYLAAKASKMIMQRPNHSNKTCLSTIGLMGFALTFIFLVMPPTKEPESIESILRKRLFGSSNRISYDLVKRLLWSKELSNIRMKYESEAASSYKHLLLNHLNSRRVVSIILKESDRKDAKAERCPRKVRQCSRQPNSLSVYLTSSSRPHGALYFATDFVASQNHFKGHIGLEYIYKSVFDRENTFAGGRLPIEKWMTGVQNESVGGDKPNLRMHEGIWESRDCAARHSVAIIIPYRSREKQLNILLHHLPTILKRQQINYSIFVIEQVGNATTFNKGILMNAGFLTALARPTHGVTFHCFIFHDVDLLAEDDRNMYTCPERPRHMSVAVDEFDYELPYSELLGGVFAIRTEHFLEVNGYSNSYWGWGGEDDDMGLRVTSAFGQVLRPDRDVGRYSSVRHRKMMPWMPLAIRRKLKKMTRLRYKTDGLTTVKYNLVKVEKKYQYTHVFVDVGQPPLGMFNYVMSRKVAYHMLNPNRKIQQYINT